MSELGPEARALFAAAREGDDPTDADRERVEKALFAAIAAGATAATASALSSGAATSGTAGAAVGGAGAATVGGVGALKLVLVLALLGGVGTAALWAGGMFDAPAPAPASVGPASVPPSTDVTDETLSDELSGADVTATDESDELASPSPDPTPPSIDEPSEPRSSPRESTATPPEMGSAALDPTPSVDPLTEEIGLLRDANRALRDGRPDRALGLLEEHLRRFPEGMMVSERDATRAIALCDAGLREEGRLAAEAFIRGHAGSPLVARVRDACGVR